MKLKSKLIATIVSICAAIAVMGVGVWAASGSFTVKVSNTVTMAFASLDGTVSVSATSVTKGSTKDATPATMAETEVYGATAGRTAQSVELSTLGSKSADVLSFFVGGDEKYIDGNTTAAVLEYTFKYTKSENVAAGAAVVGYSIVASDAPSGMLGSKEAFSVKYYLSAGDGWVEMQGTQTYYVDAATNVEIKAICAYSNPSTASIKVDDVWTFDVSMAATPGAVTDTGYAAVVGDAVAITTGAIVVSGDAGTSSVVSTTKA